MERPIRRNELNTNFVMVLDFHIFYDIYNI